MSNATHEIRQKINVCVFISGRGSNLKAILEACENPNFPARVSCIVSNKPDAGGLEYAQQYKIPFAVISHKEFTNKNDFEQGILDALTHEPIDLICLAGFMRILSPYFLTRWGDNIINIHPSLLPKYKGLDTHARAIEAGDAETGCTVHYVIPEMDAGEIILQRSIEITKKDTAETLAQRLLGEEHFAYPEAIKVVVEQKFTQHHEPKLGLSSTNTAQGKQDMTDKELLNGHKAMWAAFTNTMKFGTISIIVLLLLMALFLL